MNKNSYTHTEPFYTNVKQYGNNILYVGYDKNGQRTYKKIPFAPDLYIKQFDQNQEPDSYCYDGTPLAKVSHSSISEARDYIKTYKDCQGFEMYGMDKYPYQFINRAFTSEIKYDTSKMTFHIVDIEVYSGNGFPYPDKAKEEITCISVKDVHKRTMDVWVIDGKYGGNFDENDIKFIKDDDFNFKLIVHRFDNEKDMMRDYLSWHIMHYPDVITSWYGRYFDIPYIYNRLTNLFGKTQANKFSPWGIVKEKTKRVKQFGSYKEETTYDIYGIAELDYQDLYKKYTFTKSPSYALDYIAKKHLKKGKIEYDGSLHDLLMNDYQKYVEYNIIDVEIIDQLDQALKFLDLIIDVAYAGKVAEYEDALGTVKYWEMLIYNHLCEKGQQPPLKNFATSGRDDKYAGGFVKEPKLGKHKWVISFDLASLYPSIIRQVNIGPETKIDLKTIPAAIRDKLEDLPVVISPETGNPTCHNDYVYKNADLSFLGPNFDYSLSGNSKLYSKEHQSFLSELMEKFFNKRKIYKKAMFEAERKYLDTKDEAYKREQTIYHVKQLATKILINSAYGAVGNAFFQYYDLDNAEAVTVTGQLVIRWIEKRVNQYLGSIMKDDVERIIYIDTDSIYITLDDLVQKLMGDEQDQTKIVDFLDNVCSKKLEPFINKAYEDLFKYLNNFQNHMVMEREVISNVAVWTGKKRYFMNVQDSEGTRYEDPKFKVMGIEVVKSSTPVICQDALEKALKIILDKDEKSLIKYVEQFRKEFKQHKPEDIAFPRGTNEIQKWNLGNGVFKSGCPIHVRGALLFNQEIEKAGLTNKYDLIKDGEGVFYTYLKMPNTLHNNVFAWNVKLPKELGIEKWIDYDTQFQKAFLDPLQIITNIIGWSCERKLTLDDMFG